MKDRADNLARSEPREFVVTTLSSPPDARVNGHRVLASDLWDGVSPFALGHPLQWVLEKTNEGIFIRNLGEATEEIIRRPLRAITEAELSGEQAVELGLKNPVWVTIRPVLDMERIAQQALRSHWVPQALPMDSVVDPEGEKIFRLCMIGVLAASLIGILTIALMPARPLESQELIPPQYAKVLLSPALKKSAAEKRESLEAKGSAGNVVQAFRSAAVQKTTQGLLNAAAAKALISKSSLLDTGTARALVKGVFDAKSTLSGKSQLKALNITGLEQTLVSTDPRYRSGGYRGAAENATSGQENALVSIADEGVGVANGLTKDEVGKVIRQHMGEVRYCYESILVREPGLEGKLVLTFTVDSLGAVKEVQTKESSGSGTLDQCIQLRLSKWKFPKPREGVDVGVSYPFIFKSLGG